MATEGTYSAEQVNQLLTCPVCLDRFNNPKILPCQHTVCRSPCMEGLIDRYSRMIRCPECRAEHFVPRTGVDGFPTNITISGFLDLQAQALPPQSEGGASQGPSTTSNQTTTTTQPARSTGKCAVCEKDGERVNCGHCDRLVCVSCKQSHTDQLKMEVLRLVSQIRRGLPKLAKCLSTVEHRAEVIRQQVTTVKGEVTSSVDKYIKELKDREASLHSELDTFSVGELRSLHLHQENIEVEMASVSSYCDSMETFLNSGGGVSSGGGGSDSRPIPEADLVNMRHQCTEYMQQVRNAENEPIPAMRRAHYSYHSQPIQSAVSSFGSIANSEPGGGGAGAPPTQSQAPPTTSQRTNQRARWGDRSPRLPIGAHGSVGGGTSGRGRETHQNQPDFFTSRPSRSDESWLRSSPQGGSTPRSVYLPSRTEDYMYQMSTNTDDISEVIEEIRRQDEWEMNASIRENSRNRNTRQNLDLFNSQTPRARSNPTVNREERMGGLMGGGGGAPSGGGGTGNPSGGASSSRAPAANGRTPRSTGTNGASGAFNGVSGAAVNSQQVDNDTMRDLEEEIHNMDVVPGRPPGSNRATAGGQRGTRGNSNQTTQRGGGTNQNSRAAVNRGRNRGSVSSSNQTSPSAQAGAAAMARVSQNPEGGTTVTSESNGPSNSNNRRNINNNRNAASRGGGNPGRRPNNAANNNNTRAGGGAGTNTNVGGGRARENNAAAAATDSSSPTVAGSNNRPRRISQQQVGPGGPSLPRGRTFVQEEPATTEAPMDLPSVSNNGMSFSIAFDDDGDTNEADLNAANSNYSVNYTEKASAVLTLGDGRGNSHDQFTWPRGVAVSPLEDKIVVADSSNHRVKLYDFGGHLLSVFGGYGQNEGEFDCLAGVAVNAAGEIIIADRYNHRIQVFNSAGTFLRAFGSEGSEDGQLSYPWGVATDTSGFIYVCDKENHRVQVFQQDGTFVRKFGGLGNQPGKLENPHYVAITSDRRVLVSDSSNHRIQVFTNTGRFLKTIGGRGTALGQMKYPKGIAVDPNGYILVADSGNSRIQVLQPNGRYHYHFGSSGTQTGQFRGIEGLALSTAGTIVVSDKDNHRIQTF